MNVAITVWDQRISPVFDAAETLLVVRVEETVIVDRKVRGFQAGRFVRFVQLLEDMKVRVLICGALCAGPAGILESRDIHVLSFIAGDVEEILQRYARGKDLHGFAMPGCRSERCCRMIGR